MTRSGSGFGWATYVIPLSALTLLAQACFLAWPLSLLWLLDSVIPLGDRQLSFWLLSSFIGISLLGLLADWARRHLANRLALGLMRSGAEQAFARLLRASPTFGTEGHQAGSGRCDRSAAILAILDAAFVWAPLGLMFLLGGWLATIPALACLTAVALAGIRSGAWSSALGRAQAAQAERLDILGNVFSQIHAVKAMDIARQIVQAVAPAVDRLAALEAKAVKLAAQSDIVGAALDRAAGFGTVLLGYYLLQIGAITPGGFAACLVLGLSAVRSVRRWCELPPPGQASTPDDATKASEKQQQVGKDGLSLDGISWRHPKTGEIILNEASLQIARGSCVALHGDNGAPISRLLEILAGRTRPDHGFVGIDGVDLYANAAFDPARNIVLVGETTCLLEGTLADNLTGFAPELEPAAQQLAKELGLETWIGSWKQGMQTRLCQTASNEELSPGRRQLVGLVRALAQEPSILVLDHADRHLGSGAHRRLVACLKQRKGRMTLVIASDNPDMLALADCRYVLERGKLHDVARNQPAAYDLRQAVNPKVLAGIGKPAEESDHEAAPAPDRLAEVWQSARVMLLLSLAFGALAASPALLLYWLAGGAWIGEGQAATSPALLAALAALLAGEIVLRKAWAAKLLAVCRRSAGALSQDALKRRLAKPLSILDASTAFQQIAEMRLHERWRTPGSLVELARFAALAQLLPAFIVLAILAPEYGALTAGLLAVVSLFAKFLSSGRRKALSLVERHVGAHEALLLQAASEAHSCCEGGVKAQLRLRDRACASRLLEAQAAWQSREMALWLFLSVLRLIFMLGVLWLGESALTGGDLSHAAFLASLLLVAAMVEGVDVACAKLGGITLSLWALDQCAQALKHDEADADANANVMDVRDWSGGAMLSNLSFGYPQDRNLALDNICMTAHPGRILAIAGDDGSGKSTLLKMMLGLYPPQGGGVFMEGIRLDMLDMPSLRRQTAYLPSTPFVFPGSIADHLRLGHPQATQQELEEAAASMGILKEILNLQDGFETRLCAREMSWSFLRRVELARLALTPARLFLLDEPSQGLDPSGRDALEALLQQLKQRAAVVLTSRDGSLIRRADAVGVLEHGLLQVSTAQPQSLASEGDAI